MDLNISGDPQDWAKALNEEDIPFFDTFQLQLKISNYFVLEE